MDDLQVLEVDPSSGKLIRTVRMPASKITSVAFGGPNFDILYVTSARRGLSEKDLTKEPLAGSLFAVHGLGVNGLRSLPVKMAN